MQSVKLHTKASGLDAQSKRPLSLYSLLCFSLSLVHFVCLSLSLKTLPILSHILRSAKMPDILGGGAHTVRSHGVAVAKIHMHDWLILLLLVVIAVVLNIIEPFHHFVGEEMMTDLKYPLKGNTIPFWAVPIIAILLPFVIFLIYYFIKKDVYDLHHAILGLLFSFLITAVITEAIKDAVGRPRPDFFWRCFPDGKPAFYPTITGNSTANVSGDVMCSGIKSVIKEGYKSFPSGHTSGSFAGLGFLAWYLSGKVRAFDRRGHVAKLCIIFLPLLVAALVGVSRVDDYWHHWQDVFAGGLLGTTIASFCYLQFFPPPYDIDGWGPHAYFQMLAESGNGSQSSATNVNHANVHQSELQIDSLQLLLILSAKMPDILGGSTHTVRSHGVAVAKIHMHDWLILLLLVVIEVVLNVIEPFHHFVGEEMMTDLKYPLKGNTIPFWAVPIIAILLPFVIFLIYYFIKKDVYDLHHAILGLLFSVLITGVITDAIKDAVGRPRPDFFWRCFPDGKPAFYPTIAGNATAIISGDVMCSGIKSVIKEGYKSFPSGHTSWSFAGLGFLAWYLSGKVRAFDRRGHIAKLCIIFLPLLVAALVGVSRVDDYWHHWQDVFAGGLIGTTIASFCYLQFFPPPYDIDGWGPHAYFQMLAESGNGSQSSATNVNHANVHQSELQSIYIQPQHG
nr:lipid phosphate phosphatase 2 [Quercus suber]